MDDENANYESIQLLELKTLSIVFNYNPYCIVGITKHQPFVVTELWNSHHNVEPSDSL